MSYLFFLNHRMTDTVQGTGMYRVDAKKKFFLLYTLKLLKYGLVFSCITYIGCKFQLYISRYEYGFSMVSVTLLIQHFVI